MLAAPALVAQRRELQPVHQTCWVFALAHSCLHLRNWPSSGSQTGSRTPPPPTASNKRCLWKGDTQRRRWASPFSLGCTQHAVSSQLGIRAEGSSSLSLWPKPLQLAWRALSGHPLAECAQAVTQDAPELCHVDSIRIFPVELFTKREYKTGCFSNMKGKRPKIWVWPLQGKGREKNGSFSMCLLTKSYFMARGQGCLLCAVGQPEGKRSSQRLDQRKFTTTSGLCTCSICISYSIPPAPRSAPNSTVWPEQRRQFATYWQSAQQAHA